MKKLTDAAASILKPRKRRLDLGKPPGTISVDPEAMKPVIRIIGYGPDNYEEKEIPSPEEIPALLKQWPVLWVNVDGLGYN